jgi:hypothetical protein
VYGITPDSCNHDSTRVDAINSTGTVRKGTSHFNRSILFKLFKRR